MYYDIISFSLKRDFSLLLTFRNGKSGLFSCEKYLTAGGVFGRLNDPDFFSKVYLESGVLTWPGGIDIAPETVYHKTTGEPLPTWADVDN